MRTREAGHATGTYIQVRLVAGAAGDVRVVVRRREGAYSIRTGGEVLTFTEAIKTCFQKYAEFRGRASRPEFWWFVLLYYMVILAPAVPLIALASESPRDQLGFDESVSGVALFFVFLTGVAVLAFIIPYLAARVRRLHDTGKSGWWWLLALVPFGWIVLLVFLVSEGTKGRINTERLPVPKQYSPHHRAPCRRRHLLRSRAA